VQVRRQEQSTQGRRDVVKRDRLCNSYMDSTFDKIVHHTHDLYCVFTSCILHKDIQAPPLRLLVFLNWDETAPPVQDFTQTPMKQVA
jgi:hypothetical protein